MVADILVAAVNALRRRSPPGPPLMTVPSVDLTRYLGRWYEVGRLPNPEQDGNGRRCVDVVATYTARPDGTVTVHNTARDAAAGLRRRSVRARARAVDDSGARLRVVFFGLFGGDYWVLGLDEAYRWAVVGTPSRRRLWLLSRTPALPPDDYARALSIAAAQGYDPARIVPTLQSAAQDSIVRVPAVT
ncbi:Outer membrane lipoprotein Blc [Rhodovastum atsumiense]|uniref:Outer membrane lipoprotein Blc n=1 Tax=Rhodovastum atsumiense TaxID=504468 RepID=A0A5M6IS38_9PROT|nr:lipocalin family protein [Rhodovastum atsumiense]KAA5610729.1 lipocalin family protein [Rhodovastum atsumiense]CAH2604351.1 Outer membrane lipoprotein Blc [Rhodovastum atsumiense]